MLLKGKARTLSQIHQHFPIRCAYTNSFSESCNLSVLCSTTAMHMSRLFLGGFRSFSVQSLEVTNDLALAFKLQVLQSHREYGQCSKEKYYVLRRSHKYELYRFDRASTRSVDSQWFCSKTKNITEGRLTNLRWHEKGKWWYAMRLLSTHFTTQKDQKEKRKIKHFMRVIRYFYKYKSSAMRKIGSVVPLPIRGSI